MSREIDNGGDGFKMPSLPGLAPPPPAKPVSQIPEENCEKPADEFEKPSNIVTKNDEKHDKNEQQQSIHVRKSSHKSPAELLKDRSEPPLQYSEPSSWGGIVPPDKKYFIEEIKSGKIVQTYQLKDKSFFSVGRLPSNDIPMEHPSLSRYHAVIQYKEKSSSDQPQGFYLYDIGSTHGTYHNKNRCFVKTYYRLRVGHGLKFGGSTRLLILQGPDEDMEEESDLSVTELKEKAAEKARVLAEKKKQLENSNDDDNDESSSSGGSGGISWGMAEDATEEDENNMPDMSKNPFSLGSASGSNENLFVDDPKKTLRGWFEREGFELEYKCEEKGYATFTCTIDLPIREVLGSDTGGVPTVAEATVKGGKKKEAVVQCALEACRMLDRYNLLRQSNHESRAKRQVKKWKEDDYYDSDEDEFLDRTGTIAKKRQKRMAMDDDKDVKKTEVDTFETLQVKYSEMEKTIELTEKQLKETIEAVQAEKKLQQAEEGSDDLDSFMDQLQMIKGHGSKEQVSRLKQLLLSQKNELKRLEKLVNIAKPAQMPKLQPVAKTFSQKNTVMIGKRWGFGGAKNLRKIEVKPSQNEEIFENNKNKSEEKSEYTKSNIIEMTQQQPENKVQDQKLKSISIDDGNEDLEKQYGLVEKSKKQPQNEPAKKLEKKPGPGPQFQLPDSEISAQNYDDDNVEKIMEKKKRKRKTNNKDEKTLADNVKIPGDYDNSDPKYATWLPPTNQSGDGKTALNDKYGY